MTPTTDLFAAYAFAFEAHFRSSNGSGPTAVESSQVCVPTLKRPARNACRRITNAIAATIGPDVARACPWSGRSTSTSLPAVPSSPVRTGPQLPSVSGDTLAPRAREPPAGRASPSPPATVTHTRPPPTAIERGVLPRSIRATTSLVLGSILDTVPERLLPAHTAPSPTARLSTPSPTVIVRCTGCPPVSVRQTTPANGSVSHTASLPTAICPTPAGRTGMRLVILPVRGSSRASTTDCGLARAVHTWPPPVMTGTTLGPGGRRITPESGSSLWRRPVRPTAHTARLPTATICGGITKFWPVRSEEHT